MEAPPEKAPVAWQPLTARGLAAFAHASLGRLLLIQLIFAFVAASAVVWFVHENWFPTVLAAIRHLPPEGQIRSGKLDWRADSPVRLAESRFIGLAVDLKHEGQARSPAHVQVEFGQSDVRVSSLLGFLKHAYPKGWIIAFNRPELEPWWGAWAPIILALMAAWIAAALMVSWAGLATVYFLPTWLVAFFANRQLGLGSAWRLAGAALMPGALFFSAVIVLYGFGGLDPVRLIIASAAHLWIGWIYLLAGILKLQRHAGETSLGSNPFVPTGERPAGETDPAKKVERLNG